MFKKTELQKSLERTTDLKERRDELEQQLLLLDLIIERTDEHQDPEYYSYLLNLADLYDKHLAAVKRRIFWGG